jgi:membrane-associated phospholipid phosphatase
MALIESMHAAELQYIQQLQAFLGPGLRIPMQIVSLFASEAFVIAIVPAIYWCVHRKKGAELGLLILGSTFINLWVKQLVAWPRPYEIIPSLGLAKESTYGMPSGHSQLSVVFWAYVVQFLPKKWRIPVLIGVPLLIGFSRVYLGVHFPSDVLGGYIIGAAFFILFKLFGPGIEKALQHSEWRLRVVFAAALSFIMNSLLPKDTMISGAFLGAAIGFAFASRNIPIDQTDGVKQKILRYLVGLVSTGIVYFAMKLADNPLNTLSGNNQTQLIRFVRYAMVGGWVSYGAPFVFLKTKLATREPTAQA